MGARGLLDKIVTAGESGERAAQRAFAAPALRPYLPDLRLLRRILAGHRVLAGMAWRAARAGLRLAAGPQPQKPAEKAPAESAKADPQAKAKATRDAQKEALGDALERAGVAAFVVLIAGAAVVGVVSVVGPRLVPYLPILVSVGAAGLLAAAWAVAPEQPTKAKQAGGEVADEEEQPDPAPLPQAVAPLDVHTVAAVVRQIATASGWLGAHLDDVLAHLPGRSRSELLEVLAEARIPVENQLKLRLPGGRQRNRQGVRLSALPAAPDQPAAEAAPEPSPAALVEAPPEPAPPVAPVTVYGAE